MEIKYWEVLKLLDIVICELYQETREGKMSINWVEERINELKRYSDYLVNFETEQPEFKNA